MRWRLPALQRKLYRARACRPEAESIGFGDHVVDARAAPRRARKRRDANLRPLRILHHL